MKKYFAIEFNGDEKSILRFEATDNGKAVEYLENRHFRHAGNRMQLVNHSGSYDDQHSSIRYMVGLQIGI